LSVSAHKPPSSASYRVASLSKL